LCSSYTNSSGQFKQRESLAAIKKQDTELSILQIPLDKDWQIKHNIRVTGQPELPMLQTATRETTATTSQVAVVRRNKVATRPLIPAVPSTSTTDFVFRLKLSYQLMTTLSLAI